MSQPATNSAAQPDSPTSGLGSGDGFGVKYTPLQEAARLGGIAVARIAQNSIAQGRVVWITNKAIGLWVRRGETHSVKWRNVVSVSSPNND
jgi:hypothetical protein